MKKMIDFRFSLLDYGFLRKLTVFMFLLFIIVSTNFLCASYNLSDANEAYKNQDYQKAEKIYQKLADKDVKNFTLFYNLGNTYFKLGKIAKARLNYERAARYKPLNKDLQYNIKLIKSIIKDKELSDRGLLQKVAHSVVYSLSLQVLGLITLATFVIIMLLTSTLIIYKEERKRKISQSLLAIFSLLFILFLLTTILRLNYFYQQNSGVIMSPTVSAYSGPSNNFQQVFTIHSGLKVEVERQTEDWILIKLPSGMGGWIKAETLQKI